MACCRCIKPNPESRPGSFAPDYALEQLRAGGVLEAVRIASAGFPTRKAFRSAVRPSHKLHARLPTVLPSGPGPHRQPCSALDQSRQACSAIKAWEFVRPEPEAGHVCRPFAQRYNILLAVGKGMYRPLDMDALDEEAAAGLSKNILQVSGLQGWQIGRTRIFLRAGQLAQLEVRLHP